MRPHEDHPRARRTRDSRPIALAALAALLVAAFAGCGKASKEYASNVEITRKAIVRYDDQKRPVTLDVEISYVECPGTQTEVMRGGSDFVACMAKHKVGDKVDAHLTWGPTREGTYAWAIHDIGGCARPPDPEDEASFVLAQECEDVMVNGARVGFHCDRTPRKQLLEKCPWFRRR